MLTCLYFILMNLVRRTSPDAYANICLGMFGSELMICHYIVVYLCTIFSPKEKPVLSGKLVIVL
jgi:hypothetical protein